MIRINEAFAHQAAGDFSQSAHLEQLALVTLERILPSSAVEMPESWKRLGRYQREDGEHTDAITSFNKASELYTQHHPDSTADIADTNTDLIYSHTQLKNFTQAEAVCRSNLRLSSKLEDDLQRYYKRDAIIRQGTIDFEQKDFGAALEHYKAATDLRERGIPEYDDAVALEALGDTYLALDSVADAVTAYEAAIKSFAASAGSESDEVLDLRDFIYTHADIPFKASDAYCLTAMPQAVMTDEDGNTLATIPGLSVLPVLGSGGGEINVEYEGATGFVTTSQLHLQRNIPGFGLGKRQILARVMKMVREAYQGAKKQDTEFAEGRISLAIELSLAEYPEDSSLLLWLRAVEAEIHLQTRGVKGAQQLLDRIRIDVESLNPESYPLHIEFTQTEASVLSEQQRHNEAAALLIPILELTKEAYGANHAMVRSLERNIGVNLLQAGQHDEAVAHLQVGNQIARQIYPNDSELMAEAVSNFALLLAKIKRYESSAKVIEQYLASVPKPPRSHHAMIVANLAKAYSRMDRKREARDLLTAIIRAQSGNDEDAVVANTSGLLAYDELGRIEFADNNWQDANAFFRKALEAASEMNFGDRFEVAEIHRRRALALQMLDRKSEAQAELREAVRIYKAAGDGESTQAVAVQEQLVAMETATSERSVPDVKSVLAALLNLTPDGEKMLRTTVEKAMVKTPTANSAVIGTLKRDTDIWSLEEKNGFHRIYSPDMKRYVWVDETDLQSRSDYAIENGKKRLKEKLWFFQLTAAEKAFEEGMSVTDGDPNVEIEVLKASLATIASKYEYSNALTGLLNERLVSAYEKTADTESIALLADAALSPALDAHGYDHPHTAALRRVLSENKRGVGDDFGAQTELRYVVEICEKCFGPDDPRTLMQRLHYAAAQVRAGDFDEPEETYRHVSTIDGSDAGSVFLRSSAEMGLGLLRTSERDHAAAIPHLETALEGLDSLSHPAPSLAVQSAVALAVSVYESGEAEEAVQILERVQDLPLKPAEAHILLSLLTWKARLLAAIDEQRSHTAAEEAIQFSHEAFGKSNLLQLNAISARGIAQALAGESTAAARSFQDARQLAYVFGDLMASYQDLNRQLSFATEDARRLDDALRLAVETDSQKVADMSAEWLINGHALKSELPGKKRHISASMDLDTDPGLFLWEYSQQQASDIPLRNMNSARKEITDKLKELRQATIADRGRLPQSTQKLIVAPPNWVSLQVIRKSLDERETLVLFRRMANPGGYKDRASYQLPRERQKAGYVAWVVPSTGNGDVQVISLGDAEEIDSLAQQLHTNLSQTASRVTLQGPLANATSLEIGLRRELAEKVWQPVADGFPQGCTSITIVADGVLRGVPWDALTLASGDSVFDRYVTRVVSNPRHLVRSEWQLEMSESAMFVRPDRQDRRLDALPITDSQLRVVEKRSGGSRLHFDKLELQRAIPNRGTIVNSTFARFGDRSSGAPGGNRAVDGLTSVQKAWHALFDRDTGNFGEGECSQIGFFLRPRPIALHIEAATFVRPKRSVRRTAEYAPLESRRLISNGGQSEVSPLANCGLLVAGAAATGQTSFIVNDGIFTGEEITGLDLRGTKLVTLCVAPRSADGLPAPAGAGDALVSAFQLAGAGAVVNGLWPLDEHHADAVLQRFYLRLNESHSFDEALRIAQRDIRKQHGRKVSAAFWASFRVNGQNGRLVDRN